MDCSLLQVVFLYFSFSSIVGPSAAPTGLTILTRGVDFLELSWNSVSFHNLNGVGLGYQVSFYTVSNHTGPMTVFRSINSTIGTFRGLMFGTTYTVQVAATTDQGTGNFSSPVFDTTLQSSKEVFSIVPFFICYYRTAQGKHLPPHHASSY